MELRTNNVLNVWNTHVKCRIKDDIGVEDTFESCRDDIKDMLSQLKVDSDGIGISQLLCFRKDDEQWTPYLQPIEFLLLMGKRFGLVTFENGELNKNTIIKLWLE